MGYFVQRADGSTGGPFTAEEIVQAIAEGRLPPNVNARDELRGDWMAASAHREIGDLQFGRMLQKDGVPLVNDLEYPIVEGTALGRLAYFFGNVGTSVLGYILVAIYATVARPTITDGEFGGFYQMHEFQQNVQVAAFVLALLLLPLRLWLAAARFRDLGREGSECFKLLIPFYNLYIAFVLLFSPGHAAARAG